MGRPRTVDTGQILGAAEALYAEQGFGETSLRQLIDQAGISPTAFYARFPSREAVVEAMVARLLAELYETAAMTAQAPNVGAAIDAAIPALVKSLSAHKVTVKIALGEGAGILAVRETMQRALSRLADLLAGRITKLGTKGKLQHADGEVLAWALVGAIMIHVKRWAVFEEFGTRKLSDLSLRTARLLLS